MPTCSAWSMTCKHSPGITHPLNRWLKLLRVQGQCGQQLWGSTQTTLLFCQPGRTNVETPSRLLTARASCRRDVSDPRTFPPYQDTLRTAVLDLCIAVLHARTDRKASCSCVRTRFDRHLRAAAADAPPSDQNLTM